jgi:hypothetical protein
MIFFLLLKLIVFGIFAVMVASKKPFFKSLDAYAIYPPVNGESIVRDFL